MPGNGWRTRKPDNAATAQRKREYNSTTYKRAKAAGQREVDEGHAHCWRCGQHLPPGSAWHLGHDDNDRSIIHGPECPPCNLTAAARKGAAITNATRSQHPAQPHRWHL